MEINLLAIGHLGRDCSIRHLENGSVAINFPLASTERYTDKQGNKHERTTWIECTVWRKQETMKIADYLKKGQLVKVEGLPIARGYRSKSDANVIHGSIQCRVDKLILLGGGKPAPVAEASMDQTEQVFSQNTQEDDLPF